MGFYLRKSIKVGPLRFNLSSSGVGVSGGFTGFRIGTGPRGNYVHMGRGGLYYRAAIPQPRRPPSSPQPPPKENTPPAYLPSEDNTTLTEIESADVSQIVDSSSSALLDEIKQKRAAPRLWPGAAVLTVLALGAGFTAHWPQWALATTMVVGSIAAYIASVRDALRKTVVLFYDFDEEMESAYARLHSAATDLANCASVWHIEASGDVTDTKYHAGAGRLLRRKPTLVRKGEPPYLRTNIETIAIGVGRQTLHFFPDRVLVYDPNGVGGVGYKDLRVQLAPRQFVEEDPVPRDAVVIGHTWKYVNKCGGPDRRFKDNRQIPVCLYEEISLSSRTGLNEVVQLSRNGLGAAFANAIATLATKMPTEAAPLPGQVEVQ